MKKIMIVLAVMVASTLSFAAEKKTGRDVAQASSDEADADCSQGGNNQMEMNLCAYKNMTETSQKLADKIYKKCVRAPEVKENKGGSIYAMELANCQAAFFKQLTTELRKIKVSDVMYK